MKKYDNNKFTFKKKQLAIYIGVLFGSSLVSTAVLSALPNDLNVYTEPTLGKKNLLLMLDASGGMDDNSSGQQAQRSIKEDYPFCTYLASSDVSTTALGAAYPLNQTLSNGTSQSAIIWGFPYCKKTGSGSSVVTDYKYSRMDRMKLAMSLLLGNTRLPNDVVMGLGQFSAQTDSTYKTNTGAFNSPNGNNIPNSSSVLYSRMSSSAGLSAGRSYGNDVAAKIVVPAAALSGDQRYKMRVAVTALGSGGATPLASALAESGAYMLGTTTKSSSLINLVNAFSFNGKTNGPFTASGFDYSPIEAKDPSNPSRYATPIQNTGCNANGIFLLTNAAPNSVPRDEAQKIMRNALNDQSFTCPSSGTFLPTPNGQTDFGWSCLGEFAKRLSSNQENPIKVAVAGFGSNYAPYTQNQNLQTQVTTIDSNGNTTIRTRYKCNAIQVGDSYTFEGSSFKVKAENIQDIKNACNLGELSSSQTDLAGVGGYGEGGFYPIVSPESLADAVINFAATLDPSLKALNAGIPAMPVDTLNVTQALSSAYYSQFQPDLNNPRGIWVGNIKKYQIVDNTIKDKNSNNIINSITGNLNSTTDFWSSSSDGANATTGGALAKLPVQSVTGRQIYSDRTVSATGTVAAVTESGTALTLIDSKNTTDTTGTAEVLRGGNDPDKAYLLNLLGFGVATPPAANPSTLTGAAQLRQMGATLNSTPLFFTTQSQIVTKASGSGTSRVNVGDYINRKDYVLFGTNQGLLQVVDANTGVEKFAFLPKEMIDAQKQGFVSKSLQTSMPDLYQGIDGAWSVYANYVSNNLSNSLKADVLNVYGGLRRGGYNYYGLDLKNIESSAPKLLFKVGPSFTTTAGVTTKDACSNTNPLNCMGQSWSKPVTGWVQWKGKPQLVMIVGGGYDPAFNDASYKPTTATQGNGVYMFAANTNTDTGLTAGNLMWWGSSTATTTTAGTDNTTQKTTNTNLKYSVVSQIKTVDRDSDGFIDNLYFGDLGGQVFRVDIDNASSSTTANFNVKRIVRIGSFIAEADRATKVAPKFYYAPSFTVHRLNATYTDVNNAVVSGTLGGVSNATRFAVISLGSGDQSSPLRTTADIPDRVYGIFDRDVGRTDLFTMTNDDNATSGLATRDVSILRTTPARGMVNLAGTGSLLPTVALMIAATNDGWYNTLAGTTFGRSGTDIDSNLSGGTTRYKVLSEFSAIKNTLFTNYFDAADNGSSSSCSAGIKGRSYIKNYCLPFGSMGSNGANCGTTVDGRNFSTATSTGSDVGAGMIPVIVGGMTNGKIGPITGKGQASGVTAQYGIPIRFEPIKWSEKIS